MNGIYTCKDVALMCGLAVASVRQYATRYRVGEKLGRDWVFTLEHVREIKKRQVGDPPKE